MEKKNLPGYSGQLEICAFRSQEKDRNFSRGGRSFYFFDFDDNIAFLSTQLVLFHKKTGQELTLSSGEWAEVHTTIGKSGFYKDYEIRFDDKNGTFRYFRDHEREELERLGHKHQVFVRDVIDLFKIPDLEWKGPSWETFYHATFNQRPVSVITARGHSPETIKAGINQFVHHKVLPHDPNYLSLFPVSHVPTRHLLGDNDLTMTTAELKQSAIRASVRSAIEIYGYNDHHRFGMSDDDPKNLQLIYEEMTRLKRTYPNMCFFMIETHRGEFIKHEILLSGTTSFKAPDVDQLNLFEPR